MEHVSTNITKIDSQDNVSLVHGLVPDVTNQKQFLGHYVTNVSILLKEEIMNYSFISKIKLTPLI